MRKLTAIAAGSLLGGLAGYALNRLSPAHRTALAGRGLIAAAAIYLLARDHRATSQPGIEREIGALTATLSLAAVAARVPQPTASAVVGTGWVAHAVFDLAHEPGRSSRLPDWYPPLCVGFDLALGATLLTPQRDHPNH